VVAPSLQVPVTRAAADLLAAAPDASRTGCMLNASDRVVANPAHPRLGFAVKVLGEGGMRS